ncbi:MAG: hypothetical protein ACRDZ5_11285 [Acidimicrobiales bacterium]
MALLAFAAIVSYTVALFVCSASQPANLVPLSEQTSSTTRPGVNGDEQGD